MLDSTRDALQHYLGHRKNLGAASDNLFVLSGSKSIGPNTLTGIFIKLARATGLRGGKGERGVTLHDLQHRFAVRSLEQAITSDRDNVSRHILALSTYLGHVSVSSTYWYLHATPVLLKQIAENAETSYMGSVTS